MAVRRIEAEHRQSVLIFSARNLCFVSIAVLGGRRQNRIAGDGKLADSLKILLHPSFFDFQLRIVPDMTKQASAAFGKHGAVRLASVGRGRQDLFAFSVSVGGKCFQYPRGNHVSDGGFGYENHVPLIFSDASALRCQVGDGECHDIVFFQHCFLSFCIKYFIRLY